MASERRTSRKDKEVLFELEGQVKDIRQQLNEQLKCLDSRVETQVSLVAEIQDYFRRRAEVEMEYSRSLDKLARSLLARHKAERQKREQWHLFSTYACWQHLIQRTKQCSRHHSVLADIYNNNLSNRFSSAIDDVQRIYRRCREIGIEGHDELLKVLHELHASMKTYQVYHGEMLQAKQKVQLVETQQSRLKQSIPKEKLEKSKKYRLIEKELQKREMKYQDARFKALKARNEYLLGMDAANAAIHKYFADDLSDLIDCMDFGFHNCMARAFLTYVSAEETLKAAIQQDVDSVHKCVSNLDSRLDKQRFLEFNNSAFMIPKKFEFQGHRGDEENKVNSEESVKEEMEVRFRQLCSRLTSLKTEGEEVWKTLETAEKSLMTMINLKDYDCSMLFDEDAHLKNGPKLPETVTLKLRADKQETEDFYLDKFREYLLGNNLTARLQSKYETMRRALDEGIYSSTASLRSSSPTDSSSSSRLSMVAVGARPFHRNSFLSQKPRRKRIGRTPLVGQPKLFGGSLEEYLEVTNQEIPLIMRSCIRIINLYGLHHQGIFRVSGAQLEINHFKEAFERGEDPLSDVTDASDINSVAGVFKLYLRELREPMFPIYYFDQLVEISKVDSKHEFVTKMKDVVGSLPRPVFVVMRYLFAFLNHLSEFSDENMMDPYNLAICFGPTLLPIPEDKDQVQFQNLVNDLTKNIIMYQEEIFPQDGGTIYEKYISSDCPDENDVEEAPVEQINECDTETDAAVGEDDSSLKEREISLQIFGVESEFLEAVAQFDFVARSDRELSFKKGDVLRLFTQVSNDWWKGSFEGSSGLIPDKYILIKIKDEDKEKGSSSSDENVRRRTSSSDSLSTSRTVAPTAKSSVSTSQLESSVNASVPASSHPPLTQSVSTPHISLRSPTVPAKDEVSSTKRSASMRAGQSYSSTLTGVVRPMGTSVSAGSTPVTEVQHPLPGKGCSTEEDDDFGSTCVDEDDSESTESPQELQRRLDHALADVYTSIQTLEEGSPHSKKPLTKDTPDLVMDLPVGSATSSPCVTTKGRHEEHEMTAAERFALSNQCTLKKSSRGGSGIPTSSSSVSVDSHDVGKSVPVLLPPATSISAPASPCKPPFNYLSPNGSSSSSVTSKVSTFKPQISAPIAKVKPPVMKKPAKSIGSTIPLSSSPETLRKVLDCKELKQTSC